jgi:hypothetical protein
MDTSPIGIFALAFVIAGVALATTSATLLLWDRLADAARWLRNLPVGLWRRVRHPHPSPDDAEIIEVVLVVEDAQRLVLCRMYGVARYFYPAPGHKYAGTRCLDVGNMRGRVIRDGVVAHVGLLSHDRNFVGPLEGDAVAQIIGKGAREGSHMRTYTGQLLPSHLRGHTVAL